MSQEQPTKVAAIKVTNDIVNEISSIIIKNLKINIKCYIIFISKDMLDMISGNIAFDSILGENLKYLIIII